MRPIKLSRFEYLKLIIKHQITKLKFVVIILKSGMPFGYKFRFLRLSSQMYRHSKRLAKASANAYVAVATGEALDRIGTLWGTKREREESDDAYRARLWEKFSAEQSAKIMKF